MISGVPNLLTRIVFPVAYDGGFVWGVFECQPNGSVVCGMYDFQGGEYVEGPFNTFEEWVCSYG